MPPTTQFSSLPSALQNKEMDNLHSRIGSFLPTRELPNFWRMNKGSYDIARNNLYQACVNLKRWLNPKEQLYTIVNDDQLYALLEQYIIAECNTKNEIPIDVYYLINEVLAHLVSHQLIAKAETNAQLKKAIAETMQKINCYPMPYTDEQLFGTALKALSSSMKYLYRYLKVVFLNPHTVHSFYCMLVSLYDNPANTHQIARPVASQMLVTTSDTIIYSLISVVPKLHNKLILSSLLRMTMLMDNKNTLRALLNYIGEAQIYIFNDESPNSQPNNRQMSKLQTFDAYWDKFNDTHIGNLYSPLEFADNFKLITLKEIILNAKDMLSKSFRSVLIPPLNNISEMSTLQLNYIRLGAGLKPYKDNSNLKTYTNFLFCLLDRPLPNFRWINKILHIFAEQENEQFALSTEENENKENSVTETSEIVISASMSNKFVTAQNQDNALPIHYLVRHKQALVLIKNILNKYPRQINHRDILGRPILYYAIEAEQIEITQFILRHQHFVTPWNNEQECLALLQVAVNKAMWLVEGCFQSNFATPQSGQNNIDIIDDDAKEEKHALDPQERTAAAQQNAEAESMLETYPIPSYSLTARVEYEQQKMSESDYATLMLPPDFINKKNIFTLAQDVTAETNLRQFFALLLQCLPYQTSLALYENINLDVAQAHIEFDIKLKLMFQLSKLSYNYVPLTVPELDISNLINRLARLLLITLIIYECIHNALHPDVEFFYDSSFIGLFATLTYLLILKDVIIEIFAHPYGFSVHLNMSDYPQLLDQMQQYVNASTNITVDHAAQLISDSIIPVAHNMKIHNIINTMILCAPERELTETILNDSATNFNQQLLNLKQHYTAQRYFTLLNILEQQFSYKFHQILQIEYLIPQLNRKFTYGIQTLEQKRRFLRYTLLPAYIMMVSLGVHELENQGGDGLSDSYFIGLTSASVGYALIAYLFKWHNLDANHNKAVCKLGDCSKPVQYQILTLLPQSKPQQLVKDVITQLEQLRENLGSIKQLVDIINHEKRAAQIVVNKDKPVQASCWQRFALLGRQSQHEHYQILPDAPAAEFQLRANVI